MICQTLRRKAREDECPARELVCGWRVLRADGTGFTREIGETALNTVTNPIYCISVLIGLVSGSSIALCLEDEFTVYHFVITLLKWREEKALWLEVILMGREQLATFSEHVQFPFFRGENCFVLKKFF